MGLEYSSGLATVYSGPRTRSEWNGSPMNDTVLYDSDAGIVTLTFNRPKVMNALDASMREGLAAAVDRIEADPDIRVVVLKGAGGGFMAGGGIQIFPGRPPPPPPPRTP